MIDLPAYLKRIGYANPLRVDFDTLRHLHRAHCTAIPYENFDVQLKRPMTACLTSARLADTAVRD